MTKRMDDLAQTEFEIPYEPTPCGLLRGCDHLQVQRGPFGTLKNLSGPLCETDYGKDRRWMLVPTLINALKRARLHAVFL